MVAATVIGIVTGAGWWLAAGSVLAGNYGVSTATSLALTKVVDTGFLITLGGTALMLVPAVVGRLFPVTVRESLDGFVVGAFGALWFQTAAATATLAPQFAEGLMREQSSTRLLADALTYGVATPLATTAAGGLVGLSLWFRPDRREGRDPRRPRVMDVSLKLGLAVLALLITRCAVQIALLHEAPDPSTGQPLLCVHCERVVPDMPFCSACGAAARASSRTSRRLRHEKPPREMVSG